VGGTLTTTGIRGVLVYLTPEGDWLIGTAQGFFLAPAAQVARMHPPLTIGEAITCQCLVDTMPPVVTHLQRSAEPPPNVPALLVILATTLRETKEAPLRCLKRMLKFLDSTAVWMLLLETWACESRGGMLVKDETRHRTIGGVFFTLAQQRLTLEAQVMVWPSQPPLHGSPHATITLRRTEDAALPAHEYALPKNMREPARIALTHAERLALLRALQIHEGRGTMKITLIGRPGKVIQNAQWVATVIKAQPPANLPKGLPAPPTKPTSYIVYMSRKHWERVAAALATSDDTLIVEGWGCYDSELEGGAVYATNVTTKGLAAARRKQNTSGTAS
jgi:hypothetical protein